jgi:phosphoribosylanthranilate isomerase
VTGIKICGVTRPADAELAATLGAVAIGMIFWPGSPRAIDAARARDVGAAVPAGVLRVGVFVGSTDEEIRRVVEHAALDVVQLHEAGAAHDPWIGSGRRVFRLAPVDSEAQVDQAAAWPAGVTPLVDAIDPVRRGGTGRVANWTRAAHLAARREIVLAGGLTADNVVEAIRRVRPWAVDVSSGVEERPGVKSAARLRAFVAAVRGAEMNEG